MQSYGNYRILPEKELLVMYLAGTVTVDEFILICNALLNDPEYNDTYDVLIDFTDTILDFNIEGMEKMAAWIEQISSWPGRCAYLTQTPNQVATTMMYDNLLKSILPTKIQIVSTMEKAADWVGLRDEDLADVEDALDMLRSEGVDSQ